MKQNAKICVALILVFALSAALLCVVNAATKNVALEKNARSKLASLRLLLPEAESFEKDEATGILMGLDAQGNAVGYIASAVSSGYDSEIETLVACDPEGTIAAITVGGDDFAESQGLGARTREAAFTEQFVGRIGPIAFGSETGDVEAVSAATITSNAVLRGINDAIQQIYDFAGLSQEAEPAAYETLDNGNRAITVQGFGGPVYVEIALDDAGAISGIIIGDDSFAESPGLGARAQEEDFYAQYIGKSGALALNADIDAISGATITSTAVNDAVNILLGAAIMDTSAEEAPAEEELLEAPAETPAEEESTEAPVEESVEAPAETLVEGVEAAGSAQGMLGPVAVRITVADGTIAAIEIGDDQFAETEGLGAKALEDDFRNQFIGKTLPISLEDIDAITGATITSQAVVDAINAACATIAVAPAEEESAEEPVAEESAEESAAEESAEAPVEEPVAEAPVEGVEAAGSAQGMLGPVAVRITVADGTIAAIEIGDEQFAETEGLGAKALEDDFRKQFIGKTLPIALEDIDAITGATITSQAVVDAINAACATIAVAPAEEESAEEPVAEESAEESAAEESAEAPVEEPVAEAPVEGVEAIGSAQGMLGPVAVRITVADGAIAAIEIGDDQFAETEGLGAKALEDDFRNQFIGKTLPIALEDIDAITGATITSQAVVDAINAAYEDIQ